MYKYYKSDSLLETGNSFDILKGNSLNSTPFSSFKSDVEIKTKQIVDLLQKGKLASLNNYSPFQTVNNLTKKFIITSNYNEIYKFLDLDPISAAKAATTLKIDSYLNEFLNSLNISPKSINVFIQISKESHQIEFDEKTHFWSPCLMSDSDFSLYYGNSFVQKVCFGTEMVLHLSLPIRTFQNSAELVESAIFKLLTNSGFKCVDLNYIDQCDFDPTESVNILKTGVLKANIVAVPPFEKGENFEMEIFKLFSLFDKYEKNDAACLIHAHIEPFELNNVNLAVGLAKEIEGQISLLSDFTPLFKKANQILQNRKNQSLQNFELGLKVKNALKSTFQKKLSDLINTTISGKIPQSIAFPTLNEFFSQNSQFNPIQFSHLISNKENDDFDQDYQKLTDELNNELNIGLTDELENKNFVENSSKNKLEIRIDNKLGNNNLNHSNELNTKLNKYNHKTLNKELNIKVDLKLKNKLNNDLNLNENGLKNQKIHVKKAENALREPELELNEIEIDSDPETQLKNEVGRNTTVIRYFDKGQMLCELSKLIEQKAGIADYKDDWEMWGEPQKVPDAQNSMRPYVYAIRICDRDKTDLEFVITDYGVCLECFSIPKDISEFEKKFDMKQKTEPKIAQLLKISQDSYKIPLPATKCHPHSKIPPRTVGVADCALYFYSPIKPVSESQAIILEKSGIIDETTPSETEYLKGVLTEFQTLKDHYDELEKNEKSLCESAVENASKLETPLMLDEEILTVFEARSQLFDYEKDLEEDNEEKRGNVRHFYKDLKSIDRIQQQKAKIFSKMKVLLLTCCERLKRNISRFRVENQQNILDVIVYLRSIIYFYKGYFNPIDVVPHFEVVSTFAFLYSVEAPILKGKYIISSNFGMVKMLPPQKYFDKRRLNLAVEGKEFKTIYKFLLANPDSEESFKICCN